MVIIKGNNRNIRIANMTLIMKTILADGEMSRADIAGRLGLIRSTVSTLTREMLECGYIIETGSRNDSTEKGGRPGVNLMINRSLGCILGIYILFGEYRFVLADLTGKEWDDGAVDEILFLIGYFDPERIYIGAGLAGYDDFEVCAGVALSFLNRLYTIPQIGDADESNIDISSIMR